MPPGVAVVKCLNTVSAYELENTTDTAGKTVGLENRRLSNHPKDPVLTGSPGG